MKINSYDNEFGKLLKNILRRKWMGVTVFFGLSFDMKNLVSISGKFIPEFVN